MFRPVLLLFPLAIAFTAARPTDYSTDMVMIEGGQVMQTIKLYVSGQKSRVEGFTAGPLGRMIAIARKDKGVTWVLYPDKRQFTETPLAAGSQSGKPDLANFDLTGMKKEYLGRETVLGLPCTKMRVTMGNLPNGQPMVGTAWVADSLELPLRLETMGITQENRNLRLGPQPASLFEIPAGFTKTNAPGMPTSMALPPASGGGARQGLPYVPGAVHLPASPAAAKWKLNTNYPGGDYRSIDMATADPAACKAACDKDAPCKAWTLVKPGGPGEMAYCWLKDSVPPATSEDCCISGLKGAGGTIGGSGGQGGSLTSTYKLEMNVNRNGEDYREFIPARAAAPLCAEACAKESQCRAWTWVKNEVEPPTGHCWLKSRVPEPGPDNCCVSGLKGSSGGQGGSVTSNYQLEMNVNRFGEDYRDFIPARAAAPLCAEACAKESRCRAWTWVKNEVEPPTGHCWLKSRVPQAGPDDCCVSGVKR